MGNLKDIRTRINSVKTTRQVTNAMKMVSAAKFKKAQDDVEHIRPYLNKLMRVIDNLGRQIEIDRHHPCFQSKTKGKILLIPFSSNRGLAGAFNANVIKETERLLHGKYKKALKEESIHIIAIGKQVAKALHVHSYPVVGHFNDLYNHISYDNAAALSEVLTNQFIAGDYREIHFIYNEFVNAATQNVKVKQFLPLQLEELSFIHDRFNDFMVEPDKETVMEMIIPRVVKTQFYATLLESLAAEHGARMTAMHKATDNATELINDLQLVYNKARQAAITTEILEIVGGAEALKQS